jgi:hypothetical protein
LFLHRHLLRAIRAREPGAALPRFVAFDRHESDDKAAVPRGALVVARPRLDKGILKGLPGSSWFHNAAPPE